MSTLQELKDAFANPEINLVRLMNRIDSSETLACGHTVELDGQGYPLVFDKTGQCLVFTGTNSKCHDLRVVAGIKNYDWSSTYAIQFYNGVYSAENITATKGDAGILANSATLTLGENIDVSDNTFGGIECSKSANPGTQDAKLVVTAPIKNTSEKYTKPTVWTDGDGATVVDNTGMTLKADVVEDQVHYYIDEAHAHENRVETDVAGASSAIGEAPAGSEIVISGAGTIEGDITLDKDLTITASGGVRVGNITVNDAEVKLSGTYANGDIVINGDKPCTIENSYINTGRKVVVNGTGQVTIKGNQFWSDNSTSESGVVVTNTLADVILSANTFNQTYSAGAVNLAAGAKLAATANTFKGATAASNYIVVQGDGTSHYTELDFERDEFMFADSEVKENTAFIALRKGGETGTKEFGNTKIHTNKVHNGKTYITAETDGVNKLVVVLSNKGNAVTTDKPAIDAVI